MSPAEFEQPRKPDQQITPAQIPRVDEAALTEATLSAPRTLRSSSDHLLQSISFSDVSFSEVEALLESVAPKLIAIVRGLFSDLKDRLPISAVEPESPTYFNTECFHIEQHQTFSFVAGAIKQRTQWFRIRDDREEYEFPPLVFTAIPQSAHAVDLGIELEWLPHDERWLFAEKLSELMNHHSLAAAFEVAPQERIKQDDNRVRCRLTERVTLHSIVQTDSDHLVSEPGGGPLIEEEWIPVDIQLVGLYASEQREILRLLRQLAGDTLIDSGLTRCAEAFCEQHGPVREDRIAKISQRLSSPVLARFSRFKTLGDDDEDSNDFDMDSDHYSDQDDELADEPEAVEFDDSMVRLEFSSEPLVPFRLVFRSMVELRSDKPLCGPEPLDEYQPSFGIEFLEPRGESLEQLIKDRWTLIEEISRIIKAPLEADNVRTKLKDRAERDPDGMWLADPESIHGGRMVLRFLGG